MAQARFDMGSAFAEARALLRSHRDLVLAIAGVFLFLPAVLVGIFGPPEPDFAGQTTDGVSAMMWTYYSELAPYALAAGIVSLIGTIAISRLYLAPAGVSVGGALGFALSVLLTVLIAALIAGVGIGIGLILLLIPGLYLYARLSLVTPHVADTGEKNPLAALSASWNLTKGNGWVLLGYLLVVIIIGVIAVLLVVGVTGALVTQILPDEGGRVAAAVIGALINTIFSVVLIAVLAGAYRQLTGSVAVAASPDAV